MSEWDEILQDAVPRPSEEFADILADPPAPDAGAAVSNEWAMIMADEADEDILVASGPPVALAPKDVVDGTVCPFSDRVVSDVLNDLKQDGARDHLGQHVMEFLHASLPSRVPHERLPTSENVDFQQFVRDQLNPSTSGWAIASQRKEAQQSG